MAKALTPLISLSPVVPSPKYADILIDISRKGSFIGKTAPSPTNRGFFWSSGSVPHPRPQSLIRWAIRPTRDLEQEQTKGCDQHSALFPAEPCLERLKWSQSLLIARSGAHPALLLTSDGNPIGRARFGSEPWPSDPISHKGLSSVSQSVGQKEKEGKKTDRRDSIGTRARNLQNEMELSATPPRESAEVSPVNDNGNRRP